MALNSNSSGGNNTAIGYQANTNTGSPTINNSYSFGFLALATAAQQIFLGNPVVSAIESFADFITISDGRYKKNIIEQLKTQNDELRSENAAFEKRLNDLESRLAGR